MAATPARERSGSIGPEVRRVRVLHRLLLAFWILSPLALTAAPAQDGNAFLAAARLVHSDADAVFPRGDQARWDRWEVALCDADPTGECKTIQAGFLSPPPVLLLYEGPSALSPTASLLVIRLAGAIGLAFGMEALWSVLKPTTERTALLVMLTTLFATPIAINIITLGQNTWILFLSAAIGVQALRNPRRELGGGALLAASIATKLFPALLLVVLALQRRFRLIAMTAVVVIVWFTLGTALLPRELWPNLLAALTDYRAGAVGFVYNRSFDSMLQSTVWPGLVTGRWTMTTTGLRAVAIVVVWFARVRKLDPDVQWAFGWLAAVLLNDFVWPHYFVLVLPAVAFSARRRPALLPLLPLAALASALLLATWSSALFGGLFANAVLIFGVVGLPFLTPVATASGDVAPEVAPA